MEEEPGKAEELWPTKGHSDPGWFSLSQGPRRSWVPVSLASPRLAGTGPLCLLWREAGARPSACVWTGVLMCTHVSQWIPRHRSVRVPIPETHMCEGGSGQCVRGRSGEALRESRLPGGLQAPHPPARPAPSRGNSTSCEQLHL